MSEQEAESKISRETVEEGVVSILSSLSSSWQKSFSGVIGPQTRLAGDLGLDSMQFVQLVGKTEKQFGVKKIPFHKLLLSNEVEGDDLQVQHIVNFLHRFLNA